jgi:hypothetical protein
LIGERIHFRTCNRGKDEEEEEEERENSHMVVSIFNQIAHVWLLKIFYGVKESESERN